ncbi:helix-turn-helix domain-containing protein [bacterium]|nr:helix-turn-helix domain-containing protein [bacterium]
MSDYFMNDRYRVLECMAQRQISVSDELVIKLSQQEIADTLGFTKAKVNGIIGDLKKNGYLIQHSSRGKYSLTEAARNELRNMNFKEAVQ